MPEEIVETTPPTKTDDEDINCIIQKLNQIFIKNPNNIHPWLCSKIIPFIKKHQTINLLDNFNWRTIQVESTIQFLWPGFKTSTKRSGPDSWNSQVHEFFPILNNIEIKTLKNKNGEFQFDKQTDPQRRKETLLYDGFIFALFSEQTEELLWILIGVNSITVAFIKNLLQKEQDSFLKEKEAKKIKSQIQDNAAADSSSYKLGRDTIGLTIKKLLCSDDDDDIKWNFFSKEKEKWSLNIPSKIVSEVLLFNDDDNKDKVTRRCGSCREIGHNKSKCPKKIP
jgi:hypothetical protein